jgi:hypothetical protein
MRCEAFWFPDSFPQHAHDEEKIPAPGVSIVGFVRFDTSKPEFIKFVI